MTLEIAVATATGSDTVVIRHLFELYAHDFSEFVGGDVDEHGRFGYPGLDRYWAEPDRHPFVIRANGRIAGFALVRSGEPHDMAEFFVMRNYRGRGVGVRAARSVFAMFPGEWQTREIAANTAAVAFWRVAIPVAFREDSDEKGTVQHFHIAVQEPT